MKKLLLRSFLFTFHGLNKAVACSVLFVGLLVTTKTQGQVISEDFENPAWAATTSVNGTINIPSTSYTSVQSIWTIQGITATSASTTSNFIYRNSGTWMYSRGSLATDDRLRRIRTKANSWSFGSSSGYLITPVITGGVASVTFWYAPANAFIVAVNTNTAATGTITYSSNQTTAIGGGNYTNGITSFPNSGTAGNTSMQFYSVTFSVTSPCQVGFFNGGGSSQYIEDITITSPVLGLAPPTLTAAAGQSVDNDFNITFTDANSWASLVTGIVVDNITYLAASGAYAINGLAGTLVLSRTAIAQLNTATSHTIKVIATGFQDASVTQSNVAGAANKLGMSVQPVGPSSNGGILSTQPIVAIQDQYGNTVTSSSASVTAAVDPGFGTWTIGGTLSRSAVSGLVNTFNDLTATAPGAEANARIAFTSGGLTGITSAAFSIPPVLDLYRSNGTGGGDWNSPGTWEVSTNSGGSWAPAVNAPTTADGTATILSGDVVTVSASVSVDQVTVNSGGTLIVAAAQTLTVADGFGTDLSVSAGGLLQIANTGVLTGAAAATTAVLVNGTLEDQKVTGAAYTFSYSNGAITIASGGTFKISGLTAANNTDLPTTLTGVTFTVPTGSGASTAGGATLHVASGNPRLGINNSIFNYNIIYEGVAGAVNPGFGANLLRGTHTVNGNFTWRSGWSFVNNGGLRTLNINGNLTVEGGELSAKGQLDDGNSNNGSILTVAGNVSVTGGSLYATGTSVSTGTGTISIGGSLSHTGGNFGSNGTTGAANGTIVFNGTVNNQTQTISTTGFTSNVSANNVTISTTGASSKTALGNNLAVTGTVTLSAGSSFDVTANNYALTVGGDWTNNGGTFIPQAGTVTFNGINQTIGGTSSTTFNALAFTNSGTKTLGNTAPTFVTGNLSIAGGVVANLGTLTTHTAGTLTLGTKGTRTVTWGGTGSGANFINTTYFATAAGRVSVGTSTATNTTASLTGTVSKPYDGNNTVSNLTAANYSLTAIGGDAVTVTNTSGTYDNASVGTGKLVTVTSLVLGGADAGFYALTNAASVSGNIGTITGIPIATAEFRSNNTAAKFGTASHWQYDQGGNDWVTATSIPSSGNNVTILNGHNAEMDVDFLVGSGKTLTLNATSTLAVDATKTLTVAGTANFNSQSVNFKSNATGSGSFGSLTGSISGEDNVTVERYIPSKRAWRLLTIPVTSNTKTVRDAWANHAPNGNSPSGEVAGSGTNITGTAYGSGAAATGAGFDWWASIANTASSIRRYIITGSSGDWPAYSDNNPINVPGTLLNAAEQGYMLFVRGDRTVTTGVGSTTLRPVGTLKMGTQSYSIPAPGTAAYKVIGNPYAATISFESLMANGVNSTRARDNRFWIWDANNGSTGGYRLVNKLGAGNWERIPAPMLETTPSYAEYIRSSQAFMIEALTAGTNDFTIDENDKGEPAGTPPSVFDAINRGRFYANLNLDNGSGNLLLADGIGATFDAGGNNGLDGDDVGKIDNFNENVSLQRNSRRLTLEARPLITDNDTLFLQLNRLTPRNYAFQFKGVQMQAGIAAILQDAYLGKETAISTVGDIVTVNFSVTADVASSVANRFQIVFKPAPVLPLTLASAKAYSLNTGVQVDWKTVNERGLRSYEVEKSIDGRSFAKATTIAATGATAYGWYDVAPVKGNNYYRIKGVGTNGESTYSQVLMVNLSSGKSAFSVYPNPVKGGIVGVQFSNMEKGKYSMVVYSSAGQKVISRDITHLGGSATEEINLGTMASGVYRISLISTGGSVQNQTLVIQK